MPTAARSQRDALLHAALALSNAISSDRRSEAILDAILDVVPSDAAAVLRFVDGTLVPIAQRGLGPDVLGRRFEPSEQPRLGAILEATTPVIFAADDPRPDPYDGLKFGGGSPAKVHSCMGAALRAGDELLGVLTLDAQEPGRFDQSQSRLFAGFAALVGAALRTATLVDALEQAAARCGQVSATLVAEALERKGGQLVGVSAAMEDLRHEIATVAPTDLTVLVTGETGTGKELVARMIHARSRRADKPLVYLNCAALPEGLAESELFGHVRGAFTGALGHRTGKFELAHEGTIFLDEIGELPLAIQAKLLRALQFGEIQRVGADRVVHVDARVIAATNRDLGVEVLEGRFRADLYHRLGVFPLHIAALRDRPQDIPVLLGHAAQRASRELGIAEVRLTRDAVAAADCYTWPGNVRELQHVVTRAALRMSVRQRGDVVEVDADALGLGAPTVDVAACTGERASSSTRPGVAYENYEKYGFNGVVERFKRTTVERAVDACDGNWAAAARRLQMDRGNFYRLAKRLGLQNDGPR